MSDNTEARTAFERIIAGPPYERDVRRYPNDARSAWPGNYRDIAVDLAWCVLRDYLATHNMDAHLTHLRVERDAALADAAGLRAAWGLA